MTQRAILCGAALAALIGASGALPAAAQMFEHSGEVPHFPRGEVAFEDCLAMAVRTVAGDVKVVEFKSEEGVPRYEFQIEAAADDSEWNVDCNGLTGFVEHIERHLDPEGEAFTSRAKIDQMTAEANALTLAPGEIDVREWILNQEGHALYVFDIHLRTGGEVKVEIRADNGEVHGFNPEYWEVGE